ncbi:MAG: hypothetical protein H0V70_20230 [Ktedonobacteraceae bacterium]|nr:hypothetical protein [Ktedonobacteraceae bacterium]
MSKQSQHPFKWRLLLSSSSSRAFLLTGHGHPHIPTRKAVGAFQRLYQE